MQFYQKKKRLSDIIFGRRIYKLKTLDIEFNAAEYSPGDIVSGQVITNYFRSEAVTGILFRAIGKTRVTWEESVPFNRRLYHTQKTRTNLSEEVYFDHTCDLLDMEGHKTKRIPSGPQEFTFEFELPSNIPSTYDEFGGTVEYTCIAIVKKILPKPKQKAIKSFIVTNTFFDLNSEPRLKELIRVEHQMKSFDILRCRGGRIGFRFQLDKTGFVPGEAVDYSVDLVNTSSTRISETQIRFGRFIQLTAQKQEKMYESQLMAFSGPGIPPKSRHRHNNFLRLPDTPIPYLTGCTIIKIQYFLKYVIIIPRDTNLEGVIPITIGSVEMHSDDSETYSETSFSDYTESIDFEERKENEDENVSV